MRRSNGEPAVEALRALIRIPTVSDWDRDKEDRAAFAAVLQPSLETGTAALVVAAMAWLGQQPDT